MNVSITYFGNGHIDCRFVESIDDEPIRMTELDLDKARRLMWELKLAGGIRRVNINRLDRDIVAVDTYIILPL